MSNQVCRQLLSVDVVGQIEAPDVRQFVDERRIDRRQSVAGRVAGDRDVAALVEVRITAGGLVRLGRLFGGVDGRLLGGGHHGTHVRLHGPVADQRAQGR